MSAELIPPNIDATGKEKLHSLTRAEHKSLVRANLEVDIAGAPDGQAREEVLLTNKTACALGVCGDMRSSGDARAGTLAADGARRHLDSWIDADAFCLTGGVASHHVQFAFLLGEPDGGMHGCAGLAVRDEVDI